MIAMGKAVALISIGYKKLQILYCMVQGLYWMLFCIGVGYVNTYLSGRGLSVDVIGIIIASFGAISALLQPCLGRITDECKHFGWKQLLLLMLGICLCGYTVQEIFQTALISGITCGIILMLLNAMMPFINGAAFYYNKMGYPLNFGWARGCGSLTYSVISFLLGRWVVEFGEKCITISGIVVSMMLMLLVFLLPNKNMSYDIEPKESKQYEKAERSILMKYPGFAGTLLAVIFLLMFHNITTTYMLQMMQSVGGGVGEMGMLFALAAVFELPVMFGIASVVKKVKAEKLLVISGTAFLLKAVIYLLAGSIITLLAAQVLQMFSYALIASASAYYSDDVMSEQDKLKGQSMVGCAFTLGAVFGSLFGGVLIRSFSLNTMLWAALLMAVIGTVILLALNLPQRRKACLPQRALQPEFDHRLRGRKAERTASQGRHLRGCHY